MSNTCKEFKKKIIGACRSVLHKKLEMIDEELSFLAESIAEDTKSSAGDKYETGREMANLEKGKLQLQVQVYRKALATLDSMPTNHNGIIGHGCLIRTDQNWIIIAVSLGEVIVDNIPVLVISPLAPLAQLLDGKVKGDQVVFRNTNYDIINIY